MKKNRFYLLLASVIISCFVCSCGDDEIKADPIENNNEPVVNDSIPSPMNEDSVSIEGIIDTWYLTEANYAWGGIKKFEPKEIIYHFCTDSVLVVRDLRGADNVIFLPAGTHKYVFDEEDKRISIDDHSYYYWLNDSILIIDDGAAYDGPHYVFQKES